MLFKKIGFDVFQNKTKNFFFNFLKKLITKNTKNEF